MTTELHIENSYISSPGNTPDMSIRYEKCLVKPFQKTIHNKIKWVDVRRFPTVIIMASILQIIFHIYSTPALDKHLRFEPSKRHEIWRYVTYMLVHEDWSHLALNIVIQCIFAALLENKQGHFRILIIYLAGGATGVLGATCVHPNLIIGSSAGGYSLLLSNAADLILNYEIVTYKIHRSVSISVLILFDVVYDIVHVSSKRQPQVSWQTHLVGAITGLLLGLIIFKCDKNSEAIHRKYINWIGSILYCCLVVTFIIIVIQIEKCTPPDIINRYIYLC